MTLARRCVWELIVLVICAVPCAVTGDGWQGDDGRCSDGRAIAGGGSDVHQRPHRMLGERLAQHSVFCRGLANGFSHAVRVFRRL
jgi:hypothetical protein